MPRSSPDLQGTLLLHASIPTRQGHGAVCRETWRHPNEAGRHCAGEADADGGGALSGQPTLEAIRPRIIRCAGAARGPHRLGTPGRSACAGWSSLRGGRVVRQEPARLMLTVPERASDMRWLPFPGVGATSRADAPPMWRRRAAVRRRPRTSLARRGWSRHIASCADSPRRPSRRRLVGAHHIDIDSGRGADCRLTIHSVDRLSTSSATQPVFAATWPPGRAEVPRVRGRPGLFAFGDHEIGREPWSRAAASSSTGEPSASTTRASSGIPRPTRSRFGFISRRRASPR